MARRRLAILIILLLTGSVTARIITVDDDGPADFNNIQAAIDDSSDGDTVEIQPGTYTGPGNRDIDFQGKAITVRSVNPEDPAVVAATVIDCEGSDSQKRRAFKFVSGEGADSVLSGLTLTNGYAPGEDPSDEYLDGGAISCKNSSPKISYCVITGNTAEGYDCGRGGAIFCAWSQATFNHCTITNNTARSYDMAYGGAISCFESQITLGHCIIAHNRVETTCPDPYMFDSIAYYSGGGGIDCDYGGEVAIAHCTVADNSAGMGTGGGIKIGVRSSATIGNSIIWGNSSVDKSNWQIMLHDGSDMSISYSNVKGITPGTPPRRVKELVWGPGNIDADPRFVDPNVEDYHLSLHSLCINAGDPAFVPAAGQTDMDGEPRVINGRIDMGPDEVDYEGPLLGINPTKCIFDANEGEPNPEAQSFSVYNSGPGMVNWEIDYNCNWLQVEPVAGASDGASDEVTVSVDVNGMKVGDYQATVWIGVPAVANSPQSFTVSLHIRGMTVYVPAEYPTIQAAIDDVLEGGTVVVADGTYTGEGNCDIDFRGRAITVRSANGPENCVIDVNGSEWGWPDARGFNFHSGEDANSVVSGFTITNGATGTCGYDPGGGGIACDGSSPTITKCLIAGNFSGAGCHVGGTVAGGIYLRQSAARITNCIIVGNIALGLGGGIFCIESTPTIVNCVIADNQAGGGICCERSAATITNSILRGNSDYQLYSQNSTVAVTFSNVEGGLLGLGNIDEDPCFVSPGYWGDPDPDIWDANYIRTGADYHLMSEGWRWDMSRSVWTWDDVTSRCIDAGDPDSPLGDEPLSIPDDPNNDWGRNSRINMGAYGGTPQASMGPNGWALEKDYNNDGIMNFTDMACLSEIYVDSPVKRIGRDADFNDLTLIAQFWLERTTWFGVPAPVPPRLPRKASDPYPEDGRNYYPPSRLRWKGDGYAESYDVYLGKTNPPPFLLNQTETEVELTGDTGGLERATTYYWRIDAINGLGTTIGDVWTFTNKYW